MSVERMVAQSALSEKQTVSRLISQQILQLTRDRDLVVICLFSVIGLLVSLWFAISYAIPAEDTLVEMPW